MPGRGTAGNEGPVSAGARGRELSPASSSAGQSSLTFEHRRDLDDALLIG